MTGVTVLPRQAEAGAAGRGAGRWWPAGPALVAAVAGFWGLPVPSLWRDESVSALVARMSFDELRRFLADLDAVHALYYLLLRPFAALPWPPEIAVRLPSVLAFVAAAYGVAALGRRLAGTAAGLYAGLLYALTPMAARYAQEARSYALVSAVAVLATWLLVRLLDRPGRAALVAYGASVALLGWLHLYALLLVPAHLLTAWLPVLRRTLAANPAPAVVRSLVAVGAAGVALVPLLALAAGQRDAQVFWLRSPGWAELAAFPGEVAGAGAAVLFAAALWGAVRAPAVAVWAASPVALSFAISQVQPVYHPRYVLFAVPLLALPAGIGLAGVRWRPVAVAALALYAVLVLPAQVAMRQPAARPDDLRTLAAALAAEERPGDRVLFVPQRFRLFVAVYGTPYDRLTDLTRAPGAPGPRTADELDAALKGVDRVWLISPRIGTKYADDERYRTLKRTLVPGQTRTYGSIHLTLWSRNN
ncbi:glycosyltransferase family 39 protein [Nonomuraea sp. NPDC049607]|uniref:glycosyltransferase family 39 protein n=1 Tax=Nonomuraea sp. NPDC049607 TaxID=3154732 RepID=UPI00341D93A4